MFTKRAIRSMLILGVMLSGLALGACASMEAAAAGPVGQADGLISVPEELASGIEQEIVPASDPEQNAPFWTLYPQYTRLTLTDYVVENSLHEAQILIFPVEELIDLNGEAARQVEQLRNLLDERPEAVEGKLPALPLFNAAQMMSAKLDYVDFASGSAVRYVTQYAQAAIPINNYELIYTFQGLSDDGRFYIAAVLPVTFPGLPESATGMVEDFDAEFQAYLEEMADELDVADEGRFTPELIALDAMMTSLDLGGK